MNNCNEKKLKTMKNIVKLDDTTTTTTQSNSIMKLKHEKYTSNIL